MGKVFLDMTVSLDGFIAADGISLEAPLGENGLRIHDWLFDSASETDQRIAAELFEGTGAFVMGKTMFDLGIGEWGEDGTFKMPCFVLSHHPREDQLQGETPFYFVNDGIESALAQAQAAAGDKNVCIVGGANIAKQYLQAGLVDEIRLHLAPIFLGKGIRLFEEMNPQVQLEIERVINSPKVTHFRYTIVKAI